VGDCKTLLLIVVRSGGDLSILGFRSAGEGQVAGSVYSTIRDLLMLIFTRCIQIEQSIWYVMELIYSYDIDDLFPEQFKISEVMPLTQNVDLCCGGNGAVDVAGHGEGHRKGGGGDGDVGEVGTSCCGLSEGIW
jgi:hypothetical protein